jgi:CBS domain-containing protein
MSNVKDTNPKDAIGSTKLPLHLVPDTIVSYAALSFAEGASKYGGYNWRVAGVRASIYKSALERHLMKWWNGENVDQVTGVPHLSSALACIGIILDADLVGKLTDDRPPYAPINDLIETIEPIVNKVYAINKDKNPKHYTIQDTTVTGKYDANQN